MECTMGLSIPCSRRHNYKKTMEMVGPPGLEPGTKGLPSPIVRIADSVYLECRDIMQ